VNLFLRFTHLSTSQKENIGSIFYAKKGSFLQKISMVLKNAWFSYINADLNFHMIFIKLARRHLNGYPLHKKLGEGKFSICYYSETKEKKPVAIKYIKNRWFFLQPIKQTEASMLSAINHPSIPKLIDVFNERSIKGFVMEYKPGTTLFDMVFNENKCFSFSETIVIFNKVLNVISYLHNKKIIHRDIKPFNIIYYNGDISLIDFGFSRFVDEQSNDYEKDFLHLGSLLLFLLYSNYKDNTKGSWSEELNLTDEQKTFIKKASSPKSVGGFLVK